MTAKLDAKYLAFFQKIWSDAKIDERSYQQKIRGVFPDTLARLIQFDIFLNFSLQISSFITLPPPPPPPDICLDICTIAAGEINGEGYAIGSGGGSYGNCFLKTNAWAGALGLASSNGYLKNNISIPGMLPDDARKLRVKKSYELKQEGTSFAASGGGMAVTKLITHQSAEQLIVIAPLLYMSHRVNRKTMNEEYTLEKRDVAKSAFKISAGGFSVVWSGSWCSIECMAIKWSICEEK